MAHPWLTKKSPYLPLPVAILAKALGKLHIVFFTENVARGGLDTFLVTLLRHWPQADKLSLVCNDSHPGFPYLQAQLHDRCQVITHGMWYYPDLVAKAKRSSLGAIVIGILFPVLRVVCFGLYCLRLRRLFRELKPEQLVVVNGGHPGGDTCRAAILSWNGMKKPIYSFHNLSKKARPREQFIEDQLDQALLRAAGPLVSVSKACASSLANRPALTTAPVRVIYNGINAPDDTGENSVTPLRQILGRSNDTRICLMLATYESRKGHEFVLRAFQDVLRSVPDVCLVICGAGTADEIKVVTTIINSLHLADHVHLENYREDAMALLRQADLLVVPSQAFESFGLTIVEAMARGIPVVATDVGGIPEVLKNEEGGFCVAQNDVTGFAAAMIRLLNDTQLASMQAARGIRRYHENFEAEHMTEAYVALVHDN